MFPSNVIVYVAHVDDPKYCHRKKHILETLTRHNIPFNWMLKGGIKDITPEILTKLYHPSFTNEANAVASCCYKHYLIWQAFLSSDAEYCLVFEDDVFLAEDFVEKFTLSLNELKNFTDKVSIQYSNAANQYTPKSQLIPEKHLYPNTTCRAADAYLITKETARLRCDYIHKNKFTYPADWQTTFMDKELGIQFLWFEPTIVEQGTQSGRFASSIQYNKKPLWFSRIQWCIKKFFRQRR